MAAQQSAAGAGRSRGVRRRAGGGGHGAPRERWAGVGLVALAAAGAAGGALVTALAVTAALPRLVRQGDVLRVRLSPLAAHDVPLEIVECVFPGSSPLDGNAAAPRRVGTVVIRLAERAVDWKQRPTFAAWGTWDDGHVVIDGRWCRTALAGGHEAARPADPGGEARGGGTRSDVGQACS